MHDGIIKEYSIKMKMKNKLSTKVSILSKGFFALSILGSMSVASAADGFIEDFSAGSLPSHLEAVGGVGTSYSPGAMCCGGQVGGGQFLKMVM